MRRNNCTATLRRCLPRPRRERTAQAARHEARAFAAIYRRYVDNVYRYGYSRVGSQADAEDLTAQVFLDALQGLNGYRERGTFSAWLFTIAHCRIVDHYRRRRPARRRCPGSPDSLTLEGDPFYTFIPIQEMSFTVDLGDEAQSGDRWPLDVQFTGGDIARPPVPTSTCRGGRSSRTG